MTYSLFSHNIFLQQIQPGFRPYTLADTTRLSTMDDDNPTSASSDKAQIQITDNDTPVHTSTPTQTNNRRKLAPTTARARNWGRVTPRGGVLLTAHLQFECVDPNFELYWNRPYRFE